MWLRLCIQLEVIPSTKFYRLIIAARLYASIEREELYNIAKNFKYVKSNQTGSRFTVLIFHSILWVNFRYFIHIFANKKLCCRMVSAYTFVYHMFVYFTILCVCVYHNFEKSNFKIVKKVLWLVSDNNINPSINSIESVYNHVRPKFQFSLFLTHAFPVCSYLRWADTNEHIAHIEINKSNSKYICYLIIAKRGHL